MQVKYIVSFLPYIATPLESATVEGAIADPEDENIIIRTLQVRGLNAGKVSACTSLVFRVSQGYWFYHSLFLLQFTDDEAIQVLTVAADTLGQFGDNDDVMVSRS